MTRYPSWPSRLERFLREATTRRFCYGTFDCCLFVADAVLAITGEDLAADFRGKYKTRREALACARKKNVRALIETILGRLPSVPALCAQRGDIVLVQRSRDVSLGILALNGKEILAPSRHGFLRLPMSRAIRAWRV